MNIRQLYIIASVSFLFLTLSSCEDYFTVEDRTKLTEELVVNSDPSIEGMWATMYQSFENGFIQLEGNAMLASACDEADSNSPFAKVQLFNQGAWNKFNNPDNVWENMYVGIRNANNFLELTDTAKNSRFLYEDIIKTDPVRYNKYTWQLKSFRMDALFIKAYCYFELWKRYGAIPIADKVLSIEEAYELERTPGNEVVEHILELLNAAIAEFEELVLMEDVAYANGKWEEPLFGRITKGAALALKTRVFLYAGSPLNTVDGNYDPVLCDSAARTAAEIINSGLYSTNISYSEIFSDRSIDNPENILDNRVGLQNDQLMEKWNYPRGGSNQWVTPDVCRNATCPSQNMVDAYEAIGGLPVDPANPYANRDPRFYASIIHDGQTYNDAEVEAYIGGGDGIGQKYSTTTGYYLKKFIVESTNLNQPVDKKAHIWYLFRYAEVILNYAEAMYYSAGPYAYQGYVSYGGDLNAMDAINLVRSRPSVLMLPLFTLDEDKLRNERRVELAFEGHRFWDVRRWKIAEDTEDGDLNGMKITLEEDGSKSYDISSIETRKFNPEMYRYPIPHTEMSNYPSWDQNTGW